MAAVPVSSCGTGRMGEGMGSEEPRGPTPVATVGDELSVDAESRLHRMFDVNNNRENHGRRPPVLDRENRRVVLRNFTCFCDLIRRQPRTGMAFLAMELDVLVSLDCQRQRLAIDGWFPPIYLHGLLERFVKKVVCWECKSFATTLSNMFLICDKCGSGRSI